jgi:hypothetical protein
MKKNILLSILLITSFFTQTVTKNIINTDANKMHTDVINAFSQLHTHIQQTNQYPTLVIVFLESILSINQTKDQAQLEATLTKALQASLTPAKQQELMQKLITLRLSCLTVDNAIVQHINKLQQNSDIQVIGVTMTPPAAADYFIDLFKKSGTTFSSLGAAKAITLSHNNIQGIFKEGVLCLNLELSAEQALESLFKQTKYTPKQIIVISDNAQAEQ